MKKYTALFLTPLFAASLAYAADNPSQPAANPAATPAVQAAQPAQVDPAVQAKQDDQKMFYAMGYLMGGTIKKNLIIKDEDEYKALSQGLIDSLTNKPSQVNTDDYKAPIMKRYKEDRDELDKQQQAKQDAFLAGKKKEKGFSTLEDGILLNILTKGKGTKAGADSTVKVNYTGSLIDGTVFDSNAGKDPIEFPLAQVVSCWRKGLQGVAAGSKLRLVCPPETAYGNRQAGVIPPNSVLVFEVELLEVK